MKGTIYKKVKEIKSRIDSGDTTTFAERNWVNIIMKKEKKRKRERVLVG